MGIFQEEGHWGINLNAAERLTKSIKDLEQFTSEEIKLAAHILTGALDPEDVRRVLDVQYEELIMPIEEWLDSPHHLGIVAGSFYPAVRAAMIEIFQEPFWTPRFSEIILTGGTGWGKCLAKNSYIYDSENGIRREIGDEGAFSTPSADIDESVSEGSGRFSSNRCHAFKSGYKKLVEVKLKGGQKLKASLDHKFLTHMGYVPAESLTSEHLIAVPRFIPAPAHPLELPDNDLKWIAMMMADGGCTQGNPTWTKCQSHGCWPEMVSVSRSMGFDWSPCDKKGSKSSSMRFRVNARHYLESKNLNHLSKHKTVPPEFWGLSDRQIAMFLRYFWSCDGSIYTDSPRKIEVTLASEALIDDLRFMLLRLGIISRKQEKTKTYRLKDGTRKKSKAYYLGITDIPNILSFFDKVGLLIGQESKCEALISECLARNTNTNSDIVPIDAARVKIIRAELEAQGVKWDRGPWRLRKGQWMGRARFQRLCKEWGYNGRFAWLANSDFYWEKFESVEDVGWDDVYDIEMLEGQPNFIANGICIHNSTLGKMIMARVLYEILCLKNPQASFGLQPTTKIYLVPLAHRAESAKSIVFDELGGVLVGSPWFCNRMDKGRKTKSETEIKFRRKNVYIKGGASNDNTLLGLNIVFALIDEGNFFGKPRKRGSAHGTTSSKLGYDGGDQIFEAVKDRLDSRFTGDMDEANIKSDITGMVVVSSSKRGQQDFTERRLALVEKLGMNDVYVVDNPTWIDDDTATGKTFNICIWSERGLPRVVGDDYVPKGREIVKKIPWRYRGAFNEDPIVFVRNKAGIATASANPFFTQPSYISASMRYGIPPMFNLQAFNETTPLKILWQNFTIRRDDGTRLPLYNPKASRHVHLDMASVGCATGMSIGHMGPTVKRSRSNVKSEHTHFESVPIIIADGVMRFEIPESGAINLGGVREVVARLRDGGMPIESISMDQWNYASQKELFEDLGFKVFQVSAVRGGKACLEYQDAIYDNRLRCPSHYHLKVEVQSLQRDPKTDLPIKPSVNVDGTPGSTDVADSMFGLVKFLMDSYRGNAPEGVPPMIQGREDPALIGGMRADFYDSDEDKEFAERYYMNQQARKNSAEPESTVYDFVEADELFGADDLDFASDFL